MYPATITQRVAKITPRNINIGTVGSFNSISWTSDTQEHPDEHPSIHDSIVDCEHIGEEKDRV
jgi:hypothetical protein